MPRMPSFHKSPTGLVARFDAAAERHPHAQRRKMFGYPALFVGGNLATNLFRDAWVVRLAADDLEAILAMPGAGPFAPMPGRPMRGYATLPPAIIADDAELDRWLAKALSFAGTLPAKG